MPQATQDFGGYKTYKVMYKDKLVCTIDRTGRVKIFGKLPFNLYLEQEDDFDTLLNNRFNFDYWCSSRVLSLDREYAKEILNSCALTQARTEHDRAQIALKYHCLSLQDCFWVNTGTEEWKDINLFDNSLSNAFIDVALCGKNLTVTNTELIASDCSTDGVFPKAWLRKDRSFYLLKGDQKDSVCKEVEASKILQKLGIPCVDYSYYNWDSERVSICKCFTSEEVNYCTAESYSFNQDLKQMVERYHKQFCLMNLADYLIGNTDRHWGNWGFLYNEAGALGFTPLFDFNHSFEAEGDTACLPYRVLGESKTQLEAAREALQYFTPTTQDLTQLKYGEYTKRRLADLTL